MMSPPEEGPPRKRTHNGMCILDLMLVEGLKWNEARCFTMMEHASQFTIEACASLSWAKTDREYAQSLMKKANSTIMKAEAIVEGILANHLFASNRLKEVMGKYTMLMNELIQEYYKDEAIAEEE